MEKAQVDLAGFGGDGAGRLGDGVADVGDEPLGAADEAAPGFRQADRPAHPLEQGNTDFVLQTGDFPADRGLVGLEHISRPAQVFQPCHLDESAEKVGIDAIHALI
jgi:hypothetical protein